MIEILLISGSFMILLLIFILVLVFHLKEWIQKNDRINDERYRQLKESVEETRSLYIEEIKGVLGSIRNILK